MGSVDPTCCSTDLVAAPPRGTIGGVGCGGLELVEGGGGEVAVAVSGIVVFGYLLSEEQFYKHKGEGCDL
jgi:hypothetical protein